MVATEFCPLVCSITLSSNNGSQILQENAEVELQGIISGRHKLKKKTIH